MKLEIKRPHCHFYFGFAEHSSKKKSQFFFDGKKQLPCLLKSNTKMLVCPPFKHRIIILKNIQSELNM